MAKKNFFIFTFLVGALFFVKVIYNSMKSDETSSEHPSRYDLRTENHVPQVKEQAWGTCWAFASALSLGSALLKEKSYSHLFPNGIVELSPYFMDKNSSFTQKGSKEHVNNTWHSGQGESSPSSKSNDLESGLIVHLGGDFQMATAFLTNGLGTVPQHQVPTISRTGDHKAFGDLPTQGVLKENNYQTYFAKDIKWLSLTGSTFEKRTKIKRAIIEFGAVASSEHMKENPLARASDGMLIFGNFSLDEKPNHAINLIGRDDSITHKGHKGAWIVQDSDHRTKEEKPLGHYYLLYDDIHAAKDRLMGGVSFQNIEPTPFKKVYQHALHGFRYATTIKDRVSRVANKFKAQKDHRLKGIGFYTLSDHVSYKVSLHKNINLGAFLERSGQEVYPGFHYLDLSQEKVNWQKGENLVIILELSDHQYAYDATFTMPVILGAPLPPAGPPMLVKSKASTDQGHFQRKGKVKWRDFSKFISKNNPQATHPIGVEDRSANLAINLYVD